MENSPTNAGAPAHDLDLCWFKLSPDSLEKALRDRLLECQSQEKCDSAFQAELLTQIARAEAAQGKLTEARATLDTAAKLVADLPPEEAVAARVRLLLEEGRLMILLRTPSQARTRFANAWTLAVNAGEDFFVVDIARMMAEIEPMKLQEEWLRRAIEKAENTKQEKARHWLGLLYAELGWRLFELRQFDSALEAHRSSVACYQNHGSPLDILRARWSVGRLLRQLGRLPEALAHNESLLLETGRVGALFGRLSEETAECLLALKRPEAAQSHFAHAYQELSGSGWVPDRHPLRLKRLKTLGKVES